MANAKLLRASDSGNVQLKVRRKFSRSVTFIQHAPIAAVAPNQFTRRQKDSPLRSPGRGWHGRCLTPTGPPEGVALPRFPQNVACGFPTPRLRTSVRRTSRHTRSAARPRPSRRGPARRRSRPGLQSSSRRRAASLRGFGEPGPAQRQRRLCGAFAPMARVCASVARSRASRGPPISKPISSRFSKLRASQILRRCGC